MLNMTMCVIDQGPPSCCSFSGNFYRRQWTVDFIYHIYTYIFSLYVRFNWNTNLHRFGIQKSQICMVGDRLDTDILFGQNGGCKTLLVLSGTLFYAYFLYPDWTWNPISSFIFHLSFLRCDKFIDASKSEQFDTTRFLHWEDIRFPLSQSCSCITRWFLYQSIYQPIWSIMIQNLFFF